MDRANHSRMKLSRSLIPAAIAAQILSPSLGWSYEEGLAWTSADRFAYEQKVEADIRSAFDRDLKVKVAKLPMNDYVTLHPAMEVIYDVDLMEKNFEKLQKTKREAEEASEKTQLDQLPPSIRASLHETQTKLDRLLETDRSQEIYRVDYLRAATSVLLKSSNDLFEELQKLQELDEETLEAFAEKEGLTRAEVDEQLVDEIEMVEDELYEVDEKLDVHIHMLKKYTPSISKFVSALTRTSEKHSQHYQNALAYQSSEEVRVELTRQPEVTRDSVIALVRVKGLPSASDDVPRASGIEGISVGISVKK